MGFPARIKDPNAVLDYGFDWSGWLTTGETIDSVVWTIPNGITKDSQEESTTVTKVWLSGGTAGNSYDVACRVTTSAGRTDERTMTINVRER